MAASSKRPLRRTDGNAVSVYHPTKGHRRVSMKRLMAQSKMALQRRAVVLRAFA